MESIVIIVTIAVTIFCFLSIWLKNRKKRRQINYKPVEFHPNTADHTEQIKKNLNRIRAEIQKEELKKLLDQHDLENLKLMGYDQDSSYYNYKNHNHKRYISSDVRKTVWFRDNKKCVKCGSTTKLQFDHIIPISQGGSSTESNIELLCADCNRKKSDKIE